MTEHGPLVAFANVEDHVVTVAGVWHNDSTAGFDLRCTCGWSWDPPEEDAHEFCEYAEPTPMPRVLAAWLTHLKRETGVNYLAACTAALEAHAAAQREPTQTP